MNSGLVTRGGAVGRRSCRKEEPSEGGAVGRRSCVLGPTATRVVSKTTATRAVSNATKAVSNATRARLGTHDPEEEELWYGGGVVVCNAAEEHLVLNAAENHLS